MKQLKLKLGDTLVVRTDSSKRKGQQIIYDKVEFDVIKINRKSVILQRYPIYELVKVKI